jgi:hypothetical protein
VVPSILAGPGIDEVIKILENSQCSSCGLVVCDGHQAHFNPRAGLMSQALEVHSGWSIHASRFEMHRGSWRPAICAAGLPKLLFVQPLAWTTGNSPSS